MKNAGILRQVSIPKDPEEFKEWFANRNKADGKVISKILKEAVNDTIKAIK